MSDRIAVMYSDTSSSWEKPARSFRARHPYTKALLSAVPQPEPGRGAKRIVLAGDIPSPANPPTGCVFHTRCQHPLKDQDCARIVPPLAEKGNGSFRRLYQGTGIPFAGSANGPYTGKP
jgi:oligopeptide/dipeptide ABC transporter ATP-binding protein